MAEEQKPMGDKSAGQRAYEAWAAEALEDWSLGWAFVSADEKDHWEAIAQAAAPTSEAVAWRCKHPAPGGALVLTESERIAAQCKANGYYVVPLYAHPAVSQAGGQAPTSPPEMREEIARIIDPEAWHLWDTRPTFLPSSRLASLAKADAVLAALKGGA